jgi:hypothetical protein
VSLERGIIYAGVCRSATHSSWLVNICDRQALRQMCTKGCALFHQSLITCVNQHFKELLDRLNEQDKAEDTVGGE